jgi:hypothetical protein
MNYIYKKLKYFYVLGGNVLTLLPTFSIMSGVKQPSNSKIFNPNLHSEPSIYIPFVFPNIMNRDGFIKKTIEELGLGEVASITKREMKHTNGKSYFRVFVHMKSWANNENALNVRRRLLNGDEVKITYDEPWHWFFHKVLKNFNIDGNSVDKKTCASKAEVEPEVDHSSPQDHTTLPLLQSKFIPGQLLARRRHKPHSLSPEPSPTPKPTYKYVSRRHGAWKGWSDISHLSPEEQEDIEDFRQAKELGWLGI